MESGSRKRRGDGNIRSGDGLDNGWNTALYHTSSVGTYIWKEIQVPSGFVSHDPVLVSVKECSEIQQYEMKEDHTKIEVEKYCLENGKDCADGEMAVGGCRIYFVPGKAG